MQNAESPSTKPVPNGYPSVTPWIISSSSAKLIAFMVGAFDAKEVPSRRIVNDDRVIINAVVKIGDATVMLFDSRAGWGPSPAFLNLTVDDVEATYRKALDLGATSVTDITLLWFGARVCRILDPFGNLWWLNETVEEIDLSNADEVKKRSSTPEAVAGIAYIQKSLDEAMKTQKRFFETKAAEQENG